MSNTSTTSNLDARITSLIPTLRKGYQAGLRAGDDRLCDLARDVAFQLGIDMIELVRENQPTVDTVVEIDPSDLDVMHRTMNKHMMVAFINADLTDRANLDVRRSIVFYDSDKDFVYASTVLPEPPQLAALYEYSSVRYWSKGC